MTMERYDRLFAEHRKCMNVTFIDVINFQIGDELINILRCW